MDKEVVVISAVRTAIGKFGGSLKDFSPTTLGTIVTREVMARAGVTGGDVGHVVFGNVIATEPRDYYLSRVAAVNAGIPHATPAFNVNRLCGSGLQAIVSAAQTILLGDADIAIGAGAENLSRAPYISMDARFGARMGDMRLVDMMLGALSDPFHGVPMGVTAENVARKFGITREQQDALALESHRRAQRAINEGRFRSQIVTVTQTVKGREVVFDSDEHVRHDASPDDFTRLSPVFTKENGTVTVDVKLTGELPKGARPDLSVDGTIDLEKLQDVLYVGRPAFGQENSTISMFRLDQSGNGANRVQVKTGRASVNQIQIDSGLKEGDTVILSDMSRWDNTDRVRLE